MPRPTRDSGGSFFCFFCGGAGLQARLPDRKISGLAPTSATRPAFSFRRVGSRAPRGRPRRSAGDVVVSAAGRSCPSGCRIRLRASYPARSRSGMRGGPTGGRKQHHPLERQKWLLVPGRDPQAPKRRRVAAVGSRSPPAICVGPGARTAGWPRPGPGSSAVQPTGWPIHSVDAAVEQ